MTNTNYIEVHIDGMYGSEKLTPNNYDISELHAMLEVIMKLSPMQKGDEPLSLRIEDGSVRQIFRGSKQKILTLGIVLGLISGNQYLEDVEPNTASAVEIVQKSAKQKGYTYTISTTLGGHLEISPNTNYGRRAAEWVDGDFYLYGDIILTGGVNPKLQIETKEHGRLSIAASKEFLSNNQHLLYHTCGILVRGLQNVHTNEINKDGLKLVELIQDYTPALDMDYLNHCIQKATLEWGGKRGYEEWYKIVRG